MNARHGAMYVRHPPTHSYEPCANREFPLSRLPYLKNRMAAIVISAAVPRYWVQVFIVAIRTERRHCERDKGQ